MKSMVFLLFFLSSLNSQATSTSFARQPTRTPAEQSQNLSDPELQISESFEKAENQLKVHLQTRVLLLQKMEEIYQKSKNSKESKEVKEWSSFEAELSPFMKEDETLSRAGKINSSTLNEVFARYKEFQIHEVQKIRQSIVGANQVKNELQAKDVVSVESSSLPEEAPKNDLENATRYAPKLIALKSLQENLDQKLVNPETLKKEYRAWAETLRKHQFSQKQIDPNLFLKYEEKETSEKPEVKRVVYLDRGVDEAAFLEESRKQAKSIDPEDQVEYRIVKRNPKEITKSLYHQSLGSEIYSKVQKQLEAEIKTKAEKISGRSLASSDSVSWFVEFDITKLPYSTSGWEEFLKESKDRPEPKELLKTNLESKN